MNPESPTFEETLFEDSFEYSDDMMLMQAGQLSVGDKMAVGEILDVDAEGNDRTTYTVYEWQINAIGGGAWVATGDWSTNIENVKHYPLFDSLDDATQNFASTKKQEDIYGADTLTREDFFNTDGSQKSSLEVATALKKAGAKGSVEDIEQKVIEFMPQLEGADPTEVGFLSEQYGGAGPDGIMGTKDDVSFAESIAGQTADIAYGTAGRAYKTAGITKDAAEEAYTLGLSGAERTKGTMLSGLQESAYQVGTPTTGRDLRGQIAGQQKIKKGFETGIEAYQDVVTGLEGTRGRAQDTYDIAGETYEAAGTAYGLDKTTAGLDYRSRISNLENIQYGNFEDQIEDIFFAKKGGRVPSKESFSTFLTQLPDAGGM